CQSNLPFARSKHISVRRFSCSIACVTKTRCPQTMGVELPRSGNGTRQRTLSLVLQCSGRFFSEQTPVPCGPRQAGQFSAETEYAKPSMEKKDSARANLRRNEVFMRPSLTRDGRDGSFVAVQTLLKIGY